jgi:hypothetical protein
MNLDQIKSAVESGEKVFWGNDSYQVIKAKLGEFLVVHDGGSCVGLTSQSGILQGKEKDFYTKPTPKKHLQ